MFKLLDLEITNQFVTQIKNGHFFDAHATIEKLWFSSRFLKTPRVKLLRALINGAVSLELQKRSRYEPSRRVWKNFERSIYLIDEIEINERKMFEIAIEGLKEAHEEFI